MVTFGNTYNTLRSVFTSTIQNETKEPLSSNSHSNDAKLDGLKMTATCQKDDNIIVDQCNVSMNATSALHNSNTNNRKRGSVQKQVELPNEILCIIFQMFYNPMDLLRSSAVCQTWHRIIMDKTDLQKEMYNRFSSINRPLVDKLISCHRIHTFYMGNYGVLNNIAICDVLDLLIHSTNISYIRKLSIQNSRLNQCAAEYLAEAIPLMSKLKQIEFVDVQFPTHHHLQQIMVAILKPRKNNNNKENKNTTASPISHLSFYQKAVQKSYSGSCLFDYRVSPTNQDIPNVDTNNISYLRLVEPPDPTHPKAYQEAPEKRKVSKDNNGSMLGAFRKFPNLAHLFLNTKIIKIAGPRLANEPVKYCPQLVTLLVTDNAEVPQQQKTYLFHDVLQRQGEEESYQPIECHYEKPLQQRKNNEDNSNNTKYDDINNKLNLLTQFNKKYQPLKGGLRQLIIADKKIRLGPDIGSTVFKKTHSSLELLYLKCQLETDQCYKIFGQEISNYDWSMLREVYLSFNNVDMDLETTRHLKFNSQNALVNFFSRCHGLEAVTIDNVNNNIINEDDSDILTNFDFHPHFGKLIVDNHVLKSIALNCPRIRYLRVVDNKCYHTSEGILYFATVGGFYLTDLEISMAKESILPVVIKLRSLKRFNLSNPCNASKNAIKDGNNDEDKKKSNHYGKTSMSAYEMLGGSNMSSLTGDLKAVKLLLDTRWEDASFHYFQQYSKKYTLSF